MSSLACVSKLLLRKEIVDHHTLYLRISLHHLQGVVERVVISFVGCHRERIAREVYRLVVAAFCAKPIIVFVLIEVVILG